MEQKKYEVPEIEILSMSEDLISMSGEGVSKDVEGWLPFDELEGFGK
jgi:hypothetical protein